MEELAALAANELTVEGGLGEILGIASGAGGLTYGVKRGVDYATGGMSRQITPSKRLRTMAPSSAAPAWTNAPSYTKHRSNLGNTRRRYRWRKYFYKGSSNGDDSLDDKRLHVFRLIKIPFTAADATGNTRNKRFCYVRGVKLRWWIKIKDQYTSTTGTTGDKNWDQYSPLQVRWAIISPKTNTGQTTDVSAGTDFFINPETTTEAYKDFPSTGVNVEYINRRIARDNYGVVTEGSFVLEPSSSGTASVKHGYQAKMINKWIPINKVMEWETNSTGPGDDEPLTNLYMVMWYVSKHDLTEPQLFPTSGATPIEHYFERTCYFRNILN